MARSIQQIKQIMIDEKNNQSALSGLTSTSQTAIWNLWFFIVASCIAIFEQLQDLFKQDLETIAYNTPPNTPQWTRAKIFKFQYDATTPQVAELNTTTFVVDYPIINTAYNIITRCAIVTENNLNVSVKVAKGSPPVQLSGPEQTSLEAYIETWGSVGIAYNVINQPSDKLEVVADIYYDSQYSAVISTNVVAAIESYMANLPFNGIISNQAIVDAIQAVSGVQNVKLTQILVRRNAVAYGSGVTLYNLATGVDAVKYQTYSGYVEEETTSGHEFADTLNYIAQ
jgi:hypothetical protein